MSLNSRDLSVAKKLQLVDSMFEFAELHGLKAEFEAFVVQQAASQSETGSSPFLSDIASEISTLIPWAQEKAARAIQLEGFDASPFYHPETGRRTSTVAIKCFFTVLGEEISAQYRFDKENKETKKISQMFSRAM